MPPRPRARAQAPLRVHRSWLPSALLAVATGLACLAGTSSAGATPAPPATLTAVSLPTSPTADISLQLSNVSPAVVTKPNETLTITGSVSATTAQPAGKVTVRDDPQAVDSATAVRQWASSTTAATGSVIGSADVGALTPGATNTFSVQIKGVTRLRTPPYGVIPVSVEYAGQHLHTFVGYQRAKEYEPLSATWVLPLTLPPEPALTGPEGPDRTSAWTEALAPDGRLSRLLSVAKERSVTAAVDASLLASDPTQGSGSAVSEDSANTLSPPGATAAPTPVPPASNGESSAQTDEEQLRAEFASSLSDAISGRSPLVLPSQDLDLSAIARDRTFAGSATTALRVASSRARTVEGRADVLWPADPRWSADTGRALASLSPSPPGIVIPRSSLTWGSTQTGAGQRTTDGQRVLAYDEPISNAYADALQADTAATGRQELLAQSAVLLGESPGVARTVLALAPRGINAQPEAAKAALSMLGSIPWLTQGSLSQIVAQADAAAPRAQPATTAPGEIPASPLSSSAMTRLADLRARASAASSIRADQDVTGPLWLSRIDALLSTRWREDLPAWTTAHQALQKEIDTSSTSVSVAPQTINFLADSGRLQVTVLNALPVEVEGVRVQFIPDSPRLRIDSSPKPLRIGANSRTNVIIDVTALAAGPVQITSRVVGPDGKPVGPDSILEVSVSPTSRGIYWGLGAISAAVLILGLVRNRRKRKRATA